MFLLPLSFYGRLEGSPGFRVYRPGGRDCMKKAACAACFIMEEINATQEKTTQRKKRVESVLQCVEMATRLFHLKKQPVSFNCVSAIKAGLNWKNQHYFLSLCGFFAKTGKILLIFHILAIRERVERSPRGSKPRVLPLYERISSGFPRFISF